MDKILYELRSHQRRHGKIKLVSREVAESMPGFISVCGYPEVTADLIRSQGGTFGLANMPLYVDRVILDFDDADESYAASLSYCLTQGWACTAYNTGGRGYHIHIPVEPYSERGAHLRMLNWVKAHFSGYDPSLYKSSSVTRIPGTFHASTRGRMEVVTSTQGPNLPDIRDARLPMPVTVHNDDEDKCEDRATVFSLMLDRHVSRGGRRNYAFKLVACGLDAGVNTLDLQRLVEGWSETRSHPMISPAEVKRIIMSAQKRRKA